MEMNQKSIDALINMVSKKMGTSSDELKKDLQKGNINKLTKGMSAEDSAKLKQALANKDLTQKILSSPEAQELMRKLSGKK
jgi:response regulator of citrate/malate metabolism